MTSNHIYKPHEQFYALTHVSYCVTRSMKVSGMNFQECCKISYLGYMTLQIVCVATGDTHFQAVVLNI